MGTDVGRTSFLLEPPQAGSWEAVAAAGAQPVVLVPLPAGNDFFDGDWEESCRSALAEARERSPGAELCAVLYGGRFILEPYGELSFAQGVAHYRDAAQVLADAGADSILIHRAKSLLQARAGVLGTRDEGLPVYVTLELRGEGQGLVAGGDVLSAFVVLQELGIAAFGFYSSVAGVILDAVAQVAPYSRIPLVAMTRSLAGSLSFGDSAQLFAARIAALKALGASWQAIVGMGEEQLPAAAATLAQAPDCPSPKVSYLEADEVWAANETQVYYLDGNMEYSPPLECERDMADEIIRVEHENYSALCVQPATPDDGVSISLNNAHLNQMPVVFLSDSEEALTAALFHYNGRALVDSRSLIPPERLVAIAARYGAVVL